MPREPADMKPAMNGLAQSFESFLMAIGEAIRKALKPDPLARGGDPVRHPEGREDPNEYA